MVGVTKTLQADEVYAMWKRDGRQKRGCLRIISALLMFYADCGESVASGYYRVFVP